MEILRNFYDYQVDAFKATNQHDKGIVVLPTGTGKTYIQAGIIANDIINNPGFRTYVVNAPRIMLSFQLLEEVFKFLTSNNIDARYMAVHSGGMDQTDLDKFRAQTDIQYSQIESSTSPSVVREFIEKAREDDLPLVFFSTYNSAIRIEQAKEDLDPINIILNDEAHYLVQERFNLDFNKIRTNRKYFFTATTRETPSDEGFGMNNSEFYGEIIYQMTPREAIERGKIVRPRVHIISEKDGGVFFKEDFDKSLGRIVANAFEQHESLLSPSQPPKILIAGRGIEDMKILIKSRNIQRLIQEGVKLYAVASDQEVKNYVNGERVNRKEFLNRLKEDGKNPKQKLIIIHYDILTEGIDVPGITGILFLRDQRKAKFIQTFGRSARLDLEDRAKLERGEITPNDLDEMNKPYAWIMIPSIIDEDTDKLAHLESLIEELRDFGFNPSEDIEPRDRPESGEDEDEEDPIPEPNSVLGRVGEVIEEYEFRVEEKRVANLTWEEKIEEQIKNGKNNSLSDICEFI